jgi:ABC-type transport system substrate-binding protein
MAVGRPYLSVDHLFAVLSGKLLNKLGGGTLWHVLAAPLPLGISAALILAGVVVAPPAVAETVLRIANLAEPETLDPHKNALAVDWHIVCNLFEGLVVRDPKGNVAPGVAESWP